MSDYTGPFALLTVALVVVGAVQLLGRALSVDTTPVISHPFLSGHRPTEHALSRFHARWYPTTLLFLAFDVEMLFMYPWVLVVGSVGASSVVEMFVFLGVLMTAVVWAWREGALRWT